MEQLSGEVMRELLGAAPRPLAHIQAELLFVENQYLMHYREGGVDKFKFLSPTSLQNAFSNEPIDSGWLSGIVRWGVVAGREWAVLFIPAGQHVINCREMGAVSVPLPALVFVGCDRTYWIWAVKSKVFDPTASAFLAPLPNVYPSTGTICWGNNQPPIASTATIKQAWTLFIQSPFNGDLSNTKSKQFPQDVRYQLLSVASRCAGRYPLKDLIAVGDDTTIAEIIENSLELA